MSGKFYDPSKPEEEAFHKAIKAISGHCLTLTRRQQGYVMGAFREHLERMKAERASVVSLGGSLLRAPINADNPLPPGCYCKPGQCGAPVVMGRQTPCRDPVKRDAPR